MSKLDKIGIAKVCEQITDGKMLRTIARDCNVSAMTLCSWLSKPIHSARARDARIAAAASYADMAEELIGNAADPFELSRAKELAHHLRWKASKMNPRTYGDKVQAEITGEGGGPLEVVVQFVAPKDGG